MKNFSTYTEESLFSKIKMNRGPAQGKELGDKLNKVIGRDEMNQGIKFVVLNLVQRRGSHREKKDSKKRKNEIQANPFGSENITRQKRECSQYGNPDFYSCQAQKFGHNATHVDSTSILSDSAPPERVLRR